MDWFCDHLGTDDEHFVETENPDCNDRRYARFDGSRWRCWTDLLEETSLACVDDDGQLRMCASPDTSGGRCTRNDPLTAMIADRDSICPGNVFPEFLVVFTFSRHTYIMLI